jgi:hypothetical protein
MIRGMPHGMPHGPCGQCMSWDHAWDPMARTIAREAYSEFFKT